MKIGILTQPLRTNYGGLLQAYALQKVLKDMGHEPQTINVNAKYNNCDYLWLLFKAVVKIALFRKNVTFPESPKTLNVRSKKTNLFINKYISVTEKIKWVDSSFQKKHNFDFYIVGSDQVWRPTYNYSIEDMFFKFLQDNTKRISYAASFGTDNWEFTHEQEEKCKILAQKFNAISVREKAGVELVRKYFNLDAEHVLDPTMLLLKEDYEKLLLKKNSDKKRLLVAYILDETPEKNALINKIAKEKNLEIEYIGIPENKFFNLKESVPSVESWIQGFSDAEFVITDSFHGTVFSLIFNKPFFTFDNIERGSSRMNSLLSIYNLNDRVISTKKLLNDSNNEIDWKEINSIRLHYRATSLFFLQRSLNL